MANVIHGTSEVDVITPDYVDEAGDGFTDGENEVRLRAGADIFIGGLGDNTVYGGGGADDIFGVSGNNVLNGGGGADNIYSGTDTSELIGNNGKDELYLDLSEGADHTATGGAGSDSFYIENVSNTEQSVVTITDFDWDEDTATVEGVDIEELPVATDGSNLYVLIGDDDILVLDDAAETAPFEVEHTITLGTSGADEFTLNSGASNDADVIWTGSGDDFVRAGKGDDLVFGGEGNDTLMGQKGNNTLFGGSGDDIIDSGHHASVMSGGSGEDHISANMTRNGEHTLTGGADADVFEFYTGKSNAKSTAVVTDFVVGEDELVLSGTFNPFASISTETDDGLLVAFDNGASILFEGLTFEDSFALGLFPGVEIG